MRMRGWLSGMAIVMAALGSGVVDGCGSSTADSPPASPQVAELISEGAIRTTAPEIKVPPGLPPKKLVIKDLHVGTGAKAEKGDKIMLQYYGVSWGDESEHASSWNYEHIPIFELGEHRLLRGLNIAARGMREGGSREVIIPYNLVYYPGGHHRPLGPLDALIYKIYLVKVFPKKHP